MCSRDTILLSTPTPNLSPQAEGMDAPALQSRTFNNWPQRKCDK